MDKKKKEQKEKEYILTIYKSETKKAYVVVERVKDKDLALQIANSNYFKVKKNLLTVIPVWIKGEDLYIKNPHGLIKPAIAVVRR